MHFFFFIVTIVTEYGIKSCVLCAKAKHMVLEILGWISALAIGVSLGLIGGGGSILTVPVLFYFLGLDTETATAYSLFIVGISSLVGGAQAWRKGLAKINIALAFGAPSIVAVFFTRYTLVPWLPETIAGLSKGTWMMLLFALLMVLASFSMIRKKKGGAAPKEKHTGWKSYAIVLVEGLGVGVLTGLVGAGGGFLIIPVLVLVTGLPMKQAVGTSLLIIAAKSLIGFTGDVANREIDWMFLVGFSAISIAGIFVGSWLSDRISGEKLKPAFGWFVLVMGVFIMAQQLMGM